MIAFLISSVRVQGDILVTYTAVARILPSLRVVLVVRLLQRVMLSL